MMPQPANETVNGVDVNVVRQMALERIDFFASFILGYQVTPFHARMMEHQLKTPHSMVLAPRGAGKSTICDVAYCLWRILKNPNIRIAIASKSGPQAQGFLGEIKAHIEANETLKQVFGELKGKKWNEDEIVVSTRTAIKKEPTISALGAGAGIPGRHFDLIIGDDLVDLENSATDHQREKIRTWFYSVLLPTLEPEGELRVIGTRYNNLDLYGHFAAKDKQSGQYTDEKIGPYVHCVPAIQLDANGQEVSFWESKFSLEHLYSMRRRMGLALFNLQMQNDATISEGGIIKIEDLEPYVWRNEHDRPPLEMLTIFQGTDPAISQKQEADDFAHCTIGVSKEHHIYVLEIIAGKYTFNQQVQLIVDKHKFWQSTKVGIESVAYQKALAQVVAEHPWMPILEIRPRLDKTMRAKIMSAFTERHEIHLHYSMIALMENLVGMPNVVHDDYFDGLDLAVETAKQMMLFESVIAVIPNNFRRR